MNNGWFYLIWSASLAYLIIGIITVWKTWRRNDPNIGELPFFVVHKAAVLFALLWPIFIVLLWLWRRNEDKDNQLNKTD